MRRGILLFTHTGPTTTPGPSILLDCLFVDIDSVFNGAHCEVDSSQLDKADRLRAEGNGRLEVFDRLLVVLEVDTAHSLVVEYLLKRPRRGYE